MFVRHRAVPSAGHPQGGQEHALDRPEIHETTLIDKLQRLLRGPQAAVGRKVKSALAQRLQLLEVKGGHRLLPFYHPIRNNINVTVSISIGIDRCVRRIGWPAAQEMIIR